jgi:hypothetical protein
MTKRGIANRQKKRVAPPRVWKEPRLRFPPKRGNGQKTASTGIVRPGKIGGRKV